MSKLRLLAFAVVWFLPVVIASATDSTEPVLEPDAAVLAKLEALGDNSCCILDGTRIIEDLGDFAKGWHRMKETGPTGRDFTIKMVWMPDRKRAFFCGANHNSPHRFNDAWEYDLASNTWVLLYTPDYNDRGPIPTEKPWPRNAFGASLEYIPELGGSLWQYRDHTWLFDSGERSWSLLCAEKASLPIETLVCYDPGRDLLIAHRGPVKDSLPRTWHMSLKNGTPSGWAQILEAADLPNGHDARSWMYFDPVCKVAFLYERETKAIWSYNPDEKKWTELAPQGPPPPFEPRERVIAYMDLARSVFVVVGYGGVWCYRYRKP